MTDSLKEVKRKLVERASLDPALLDCASFERILRDRLQKRGLENLREYGAVLDRDAAEVQQLVEQVSVSETWFFRYPESFGLLVRHLQTLRSKESAARPLRMLSIACATGEEPYSMAIAAAQAGWPLEQVTVDAADRNEQDIAFARRAIYAAGALRDDAPDWASPWLRRAGPNLRVSPAVADAVNWIVADVLRAPDSTFGTRYEIIFCRNLLIYLHDSARQRLIDKLAAWLSEGGLLFVGHAERTEAVLARFELASTPHAFALRKLPPRASRVESPDNRGRGRPKPTVPSALGRQSPTPNPTTNSTRRPSDKSRSGQPRTTLRLDPARSAELSRRDSGPTAGARRQAGVLSDARRLADGGHLPEALELIETLVAECEPNAGAFSLLGSVHLAMGNLAAAREALLRSVYLAPRCEDTLLQLALVYERQGKAALSARYRHRAAEVHRSNVPEES
jgi:chemotaxis protein methyltransferase WspC